MFAALYNMVSVLNARMNVKSEEGQDMAEYGLLLALIAIIVVVALVTLGPIIAGVFEEISTSFTPA